MWGPILYVLSYPSDAYHPLCKIVRALVGQPEALCQERYDSYLAECHMTDAPLPQSNTGHSMTIDS